MDAILAEDTRDGFLDRRDKYMAFLFERLRRNVEVFVYNPEEFERIKDMSFVSRALREGRIVYER